MQDMREHAGRWVRVSGGEGQDEANQIPEVDAWIASHDYELSATYTIHGKSAFHKSKKFQALWNQVLADIASHKISVLVVWKSDRIDRMLETTAMLKQVVDAGGRVEFTSQPHLNDLTTMGGRISLKVQEEIAYAESHDKADRVNIALKRAKGNNGVTGRPTYGYKAEGAKYSRQLVQVPAEADVIREAARRYLGGETIDAICDDFNARHIASPTWKGEPGKHWHAKTLAGLLRSESTAGRRRQGSAVHRYAGILTWDEHTRLVARLDSRAHRKGISPGNTSLLISLLKCGSCGRPMNKITAGTNGARYPAYYCRSGKDGCKMLVAVADADAQAKDRFLEVMGHHQWRIWEPTQAANHQDEIDQLRQDRNGLDDMAGDYDERHAAITAQIRELAEVDRQAGIDGPAVVMVAVKTGKTIAQRFRAMDDAGKRQDMIDAGVTFTASKDAGVVTLAIVTTSDKCQAYIHALNLKTA